VRNVSDRTKDFWLAAGLSLFATAAFYFTTKATLHDFDCIGRIASALLHGHLGLGTQPGAWLKQNGSVEGSNMRSFPLAYSLMVLHVT
jgi:hypothetical protein